MSFLLATACRLAVPGPIRMDDVDEATEVSPRMFRWGDGIDGDEAW